MGALLTGIGIAAASNALDTILLRQGRNIAGIIPDCVIEERHKDDLEITSSPIEQGSPVNDHAYLRQPELVMRVAWSDSKSIPALLTSFSFSIKDTYKQLLKLQSTFTPFSVSTGKRSYTNMMMRGLSVITTRESEHSLMAEITFQKVNIVSTSVASPSSVGALANQSNPQNTAAPVATGSQQLGQPNAAAGDSIGEMYGL